MKAILFCFLALPAMAGLMAQSFEWTSDIYPGSIVLDIEEIDGRNIAVVGNGELFAPDSTITYQVSFYEMQIGGGSTGGMEVIHEATLFYPDGFATYSASFVEETRRWILVQSKNTGTYTQRYRVLLYDEYLNLIDSTVLDTAGLPMFSHFDEYDQETRMIGSILAPPDDEILYMRYNHLHPDSLPPLVVKQSLPQSMFWITSMCTDSRTGNMITFYYNGIADLDTSLFQVRRFDVLTNIGTRTHGTALEVNYNYYSHGSTHLIPQNGVRNLVFHQYDTNFTRLFADTFGILGQDNYPFYKKSLDYRNGEFLMGAHLDGPFNGLAIFERKKRFYLAKYDESMEQRWYKEYGGDKAYWFAGLELLSDGGGLLYGFLTDSTDEKRYAYLMHVDSNGDLISAISPDLFSGNFTVINPGAENFIVLNSDDKEASIQLFSMHGNLVLNEPLQGGINEFVASHLPSGAYPYVILSKDRVEKRGQWIKSK